MQTDAHPPSVPDEVIVVGSGPSGLAAAHRISRAGVKVRLLEAADRVGGKMSTVNRDGFVVDNGAFFITSRYHNLLSIANELGMGDEVVQGRFVLGVLRDGVRHELDGDKLLSSVATTRLLSPRAKAQLLKLLPELVRSRRASYDSIDTLGELDTQSITAWARANLSAELAEHLVGAFWRGIAAQSGEENSRVDFIALLRLMGGAKLSAFKHGMSSYAERIAQDVKIDLGANVVDIDETDSGVVVTWVDQSETRQSQHAAACVVAVPGEVSAELVTPLDPWRREFLRSVNNNPMMVVSIGLSRRPPVESTYVLVSQSAHPFIAGVMFDHHKATGRAPDGKGLMSVALLDTWCREHWGDEDVQITGAVLDGLGAILPEVFRGADVEFVAVRRWHLEVNPIGYYRNLGRFRRMCESDSRIQLAGDSQSMQNLEAATTTGLRAADRLLASGVLRS